MSKTQLVIASLLIAGMTFVLLLGMGILSAESGAGLPDAAHDQPMASGKDSSRWQPDVGWGEGRSPRRVAGAEPASAVSELEDSASESQPTRESVVTPLLTVRARSQSGPVSEARASWHSHPPINPASQALWWSEALARSLQPVLTGLEVAVDTPGGSDWGQFAFTSSPIPSETGSYVAVTLPGHLAAVIECDGDQGAAVNRLEVTLEPAPLVEVLVHDVQGLPIPGAQIHSLGWVEGIHKRLVERRYIADAQGAVRIGSLPNTSILVASHAGNRSPIWHGAHLEATSPLILTVADSFSARGLIGGAPHPSVFEDCSVQVRLDGRRGLRDGQQSIWGQPLAAAQVDSLGGWKMDSVPWAGQGEYVFRMQTQGATPSELSLFMDHPEDVQVDLKYAAGLSMLFRVREASDGETPIAGAIVTARWAVGGGWMRSVSRSAGDGMVPFDCLPEGSVFMDVTARGFSSASFGPYSLPAMDAEYINLLMEPAGVVRGRCTFEDSPIEDFELTYWGGDPSQRYTQQITKSEDGRFTLADVPLGQVHLYATSQGLAPSAALQVETHPASALARSEDLVELQLTTPNSGTGMVIDGASGEPIVGATVSAQATSGSVPLDAWGDPVQTDSAGRFRGVPLGKSGSALAVDAPGYGRWARTIARTELASGDLGVIALDRFERLEVQITAVAKTDFTEYWCVLDGHDPVRFDELGLVHFEEIPVGGQYMGIQTEDPSKRIDTSFHVFPGQRNRIQIPVNTGVDSVIELVVADGVELPQWLFLGMSYSSEESGNVRAMATFDENKRVELALLPDREVVLSVLDYSNTTLASRWVKTSSNGGETILIELSAQKHVLAFEDHEGNPLPKAWVRFAAPPLDQVQGWISSDTDSEGLLEIHNTTADTLLVYASLPGIASHVHRVDLGSGEGQEPILVALDLSERLDVYLAERGQAIPGLKTSLNLAPSGGRLLSGMSDPQGHFEYGALSSGAYEIRVEGSGYWKEREEIRVPCDGDALRLEVRRVGSVRVTVRKGGVPVAGLATDLVYEERGQSASDWVRAQRVMCGPSGLITDANGQIALSGIPNGSYRLQLLLPGGGLYEQSIVVSPGPETAIEIDLP